MRQYRSFFWPGILILIGVLALLANLNILSPERLNRLADLWPVIVIVLGLLLLVRRAPIPAATEAIAVTAVLLVAAVGTVAYVALGPTTPGGTHVLDAHQAAPGNGQASVEIDVGGATIKVTGSDSLGSDIYKAHIIYSGPVPTVDFDQSANHLQISQNGGTFFFFTSQRFQVDLQLNTNTTWDIVIHSGGSTNTLDLANTKLSSLELNTGGSTEDITLGPPSGAVPININGGALNVRLHRPADAAAFVRVEGGSVNLNFDGKSSHAFGSVEAGSQDAADRYDVQVNGGACNVTMDTATPSG
jgi:cell wall-active antibiotic response 4TMS protein YvqF